jgi:hypothetical protein
MNNRIKYKEETLNRDFTRIVLNMLFLFFMVVSVITLGGCEEKNRYDMGSLDTEMHDEEDFEEHIADAKRSARNENFSAAYRYLDKARELGVSQRTLSDTKRFVEHKEERYNERLEQERQARLAREREERLSRQSRDDSRSYSVSSGGQKYGCKFHCTGQADMWRGPEFHVNTPKTNTADAQDYVREKYKATCRQYPFYSGGGGKC